MVAWSIIEAKYLAMSAAIAEQTWITFLLQDIGISYHKLVQFFSDNLNALSMIVNLVFHARIKHIDIDFHL